MRYKLLRIDLLCQLAVIVLFAFLLLSDHSSAGVNNAWKIYLFGLGPLQLGFCILHLVRFGKGSIGRRIYLVGALGTCLCYALAFAMPRSSIAYLAIGLNALMPAIYLIVSLAELLIVRKSAAIATLNAQREPS